MNITFVPSVLYITDINPLKFMALTKKYIVSVHLLLYIVLFIFIDKYCPIQKKNVSRRIAKMLSFLFELDSNLERKKSMQLYLDN